MYAQSQKIDRYARRFSTTWRQKKIKIRSEGAIRNGQQDLPLACVCNWVVDKLKNRGANSISVSILAPLQSCQVHKYNAFSSSSLSHLRDHNAYCTYLANMIQTRASSFSQPPLAKREPRLKHVSSIDVSQHRSWERYLWVDKPCMTPSATLRLLSSRWPFFNE